MGAMQLGRKGARACALARAAAAEARAELAATKGLLVGAWASMQAPV